MTITAEQAKAELARRAGAGATPAPAAPAGGITPGQAQAELERRKSAGAENQPGVLQQLFDIKNSSTGESYLYGNTPAPTQFEDVQRTVGDTVTRGYLDKFQGPEAQARTAAARERMPDWVEIPLDIGASVASSPYRVGSVAAGAGIGALEGAASAYGHQENWIPGTDDLLEIGKSSAVNAVFGAGGAKLGEVYGTNTSRGADQPYKSDQALQQASEEAKRLAPGGPRAADLEDRVSRLADVRSAEKTGRDAFANLRAGTPEEAAARDAISGAPKPGITKIAETVDKYGKKVPPLQTIVMEALLSGGIPYKTAAAYAAKMALSKAGQAADMPNAHQVEYLASLTRDPRGIGNTGTDQATIDFWRDRLSKLAVGAGKDF